MIVGLGVERLNRAPFEAALEARATGAGGASLALTDAGLVHRKGRSGGA